MQPIRQIYDDAPDMIPVPPELRHRRVELILWPLDDETVAARTAFIGYERTSVEKIVIPSREERNAR